MSAIHRHEPFSGMGDREHEPADVESGGGAVTDPLLPPVTEAQAQTLATQALALASKAQALATQAQTLLAPCDHVEQAEKDSFAYREIANLHDINRKYPILKLALEDWQHKAEYLSRKISRAEGRTVEFTNQIYFILGIFVLFVGSVVTTVSQLTQKASIEVGGAPLCGKIWFPIVLTGFATAVTIAGILFKLASLQSLETTIWSERKAVRELRYRVSLLRALGPQSFKFHEVTDRPRHAAFKSKIVKKRFLVIVSLLIFAAIFILFYFVILCDSWVR